MSKFVLDGPISVKKLEENFAILVEQLISLKDEITKLRQHNQQLEERITHLEKELKDTKSLLSDNARSRNMIIRSYSTTGLVSKFIPENS